MTRILQIETATQVCSAALSQNGKTIALKELEAQNIHAAHLTLFIDEVMQQAGLDYKDLDAVAVSQGPGSYTGLRIGVSTAKGICFAVEKPLIAIPTLQLMAKGFLEAEPDYQGLVCPMIDARRMEVFTALYDERLQEHMPVSAEIIAENAYAAQLSEGKITFIGDGAMKCSAVIQAENARFSALNFNTAAHMSMLAFQAFQQSEFQDVAYFEPYYLKDFLITPPKKRI